MATLQDRMALAKQHYERVQQKKIKKHRNGRVLQSK